MERGPLPCPRPAQEPPRSVDDESEGQHQESERDDQGHPGGPSHAEDESQQAEAHPGHEHRQTAAQPEGNTGGHRQGAGLALFELPLGGVDADFHGAECGLSSARSGRLHPRS